MSGVSTAAVRAAVARALPRGMLAAGRVYLAAQLVRFDRNSAGGTEWAPLAPRTVARKGNARVLVDTGSLRASLTPGDPNNVCEVVPGPSGPVLRAGTRHPVAQYHQAGGPNLPRRPVVEPPTPDVAALLRRAAADEVRRAVRAAARG